MNQKTKDFAKLARYLILQSTTAAGTGHPTSSLSATDLLVTMLANGFFKADLENPDNPNNDRLIFSKGHASPLFYSLYCLLDKISYEELLTLRKFDSRLEGHPTMNFPYTEAATGSLGQGLSVGAGMALNAKMDSLDYKTFVLLGDSELAEGSNWEAAQIAGFYKLNNLIAIADINRLGQRGQTMEAWDLDNHKAKFEAFGWEIFEVDGHDLEQIDHAFNEINSKEHNNIKPKIILAKTKKGAGISFLEDKEGWHGKALKTDELAKALDELGEVDTSLRIELPFPSLSADKILKQVQDDTKPVAATSASPSPTQISSEILKLRDSKSLLSPRKAYGLSIAGLGSTNDKIVVLDAETSNSTFADIFKHSFPDHFIECFIAEQNMVGMALGFSRRGKIPFVSTFAAFFSRAFDQIRMSQYSNSNIKYIGSHAGVSIGEDGSSQMALEDIASFRAVHGMTVLYPSDAVSTAKITDQATNHFGNVYIRITRADLPFIYNESEEFPIGGSKTLKSSSNDVVTVFAAGITLHEALKAYGILQKENINIRIVDLYSIKPLDLDVISKACRETKALIVVEDHYPEGGIYEAICGSGRVTVPTHSLAVNKIPRSGKPAELLRFEEIDALAIVEKVKALI